MAMDVWQLFIKKPKKYIVVSQILLLLFDLLFRREALRQQLNGFLMILFLGDIERTRVGTATLDCAIAAKVD